MGLSEIKKGGASELVEASSEVVTAGQDWAGVAYIDPDAIGANPTAKIYPDGSIVGSTDNGSYTKYPNSMILIGATYAASGTAFLAITYPIKLINASYTVSLSMSTNDYSDYIAKHTLKTVDGISFATKTGTSFFAVPTDIMILGKWK